MDPVAIVVADRTGTIRFWNEGAAHLFGHAEESALGATLDLIVPALLRERHWNGFHRAWRDRISDDVRVALIPVLCADEETRLFAGRFVPVRGPHGDRRPDGRVAGARERGRRTVRPRLTVGLTGGSPPLHCGPLPTHRPAGLLVVVVILTSVTWAATACSTGGHEAAGQGVHTADASTGCARRVGPGAVAPGREATQKLAAGAVSGSYQLTVPASSQGRHPAPLIILFYGFNSDPAEFSALTGLPGRGARHGYLVAVPHDQPGESEWQFSGHGTDAAFVDALVGALKSTYCVDRDAVFAAGFSAGAAFTIAYACAHQPQVAAIATVAVEFQLGCNRPISILAFHGTADPAVPYEDGAPGLSLPGVKVRGTERNMGDWARLDRCRALPRRTRIGSQVDEQRWGGCAAGTSVTLVTVLGGGHSWPGADPARAIGLTTEQVSATSQILSFFGRVPS